MIRTYDKRLGVLLSTFEICVALCAVALLPFTFGVASCLLTSVTGALWLAFMFWNEALGKRNTAKTHYYFFPTHEEKWKASDRNVDHPETLVKRPKGFAMMEHVRCDAKEASPTTVGSKDKAPAIDTPEAFLQIVCYTSFLIWIGLAIVYAPYALNVSALAVLVIGTWYMSLINLTSMCAYVNDPTVHFSLILFVLLGASFASVTLSTFCFTDAGEIVAYALVVVVAPFVLCMLSPAQTLEFTVSATLAERIMHTIHAAEVYLYSWWFYRASTESAWWSMQLVWTLGGDPVSFGEYEADAMRIVFSILALTCALIVAFDAVTYGFPRMIAIS